MSLRDYVNLLGISCLVCSKRLDQNPKKLLCPHAYCEQCLTSLLSTDNTLNMVTCPVCEHPTRVVTAGNISCLDTDVELQKKISDVSNLRQLCTNCELSENNTAEIYCEICNLFMCSMCHGKHNAIKPTSKHRTFLVDEIRKGNVFLDNKIPCKNHTGDEGRHFCTLACLTCKKAICEECKAVVHSGHDVQELTKYKEVSQAKTKSLQEEAVVVLGNTKRRINSAVSEESTASNHINNIIRSTQQSAGIIINSVRNREDILIRQSEDYKQSTSQKYQKIRKGDERILTQVKSASELLSRNTSSQFGDDTVAIRTYLTHRLQEMVAGDVDEQEYRRRLAEITREAKQIEFTPDVNKLLLGHITFNNNASSSDDPYTIIDHGPPQTMPGACSAMAGRKRWILTKDIALPAGSPMQCLTATPDGKVAIGPKRSGIIICSRSGDIETMSSSPLISDVSGLAFTSKGYCVARTRCNKVMMYTADGDKLDVKFNSVMTLWTFLKKGPCGNITVDGDDNIYVNHIRDRKIEVFPITGGKPLRTIPCSRFKPEDIFAMKSRKMLVVSSGGQSVSLIDEFGRIKKQVHKADQYVFPALRPDDSILLARVDLNKRLLSVEHYSQDLDHLATIISDQQINVPTNADWFALQESLSGDIAFCTSERLYLFSLSSS